MDLLAQAPFKSTMFAEMVGHTKANDLLNIYVANLDLLYSIFQETHQL